ncbi:hypothetical protein J1N35_004659 [Gossypium stocksii]|uniref:Uncharacterized protein n=1 Tax=Gossypium stocksii TaxID=47602 RepID=A0A9D3WBD3_9ROSI|nr:hypothetical protein J1N35_004659 [Gossypium stocksii]
MKAEECKAELAAEKERRIIAEAELIRVTTRLSTKVERIIRECQEQVTCGPFDVHKVDFNALVDVDMSSLGFNIFNLFGSAWESFVVTRKGELFVEEGEGFATLNMAPSVVRDAVNLVPPSIIGGVIVASSAAEGVAPVNANQGARGLMITPGSFAFADYFGGHGSSPVNLDFVAETFALANYFGGHNSSFPNLNFTVESFALANYFGSRGSSPANLDFTARSFTLTNCFRGRSSSPENLDFLARSFSLLTVLEVAALRLLS